MIASRKAIAAHEGIGRIVQDAINRSFVGDSFLVAFFLHQMKRESADCTGDKRDCVVNC